MASVYVPPAYSGHAPPRTNPPRRALRELKGAGFGHLELLGEGGRVGLEEAQLGLEGGLAGLGAGLRLVQGPPALLELGVPTSPSISARMFFLSLPLPALASSRSPSSVAMRYCSSTIWPRRSVFEDSSPSSSSSRSASVAACSRRMDALYRRRSSASLFASSSCIFSPATLPLVWDDEPALEGATEDMVEPTAITPLGSHVAAAASAASLASTASSAASLSSAASASFCAEDVPTAPAADHAGDTPAGSHGRTELL